LQPDSLAIGLFQLRLYIFLPLLFILLQSVQTIANNDVTDIPGDIVEIFPSATRIGQTDPELKIIPVYQLGQLLGYVFESDDFYWGTMSINAYWIT